MSLFPPYAVVLLLAATAALLVAGSGSPAWQDVQAGSGLSSEDRGELLFALVFVGSVGLALALFWLAELLATLGRLVSGQGLTRALVRLGLTFLPLAVLVAGVRFLSPWLLEVASECRRMLTAMIA